MRDIELYPGYFRACFQLIYWVFFRPITLNLEARKYWDSDLTRFKLISLGAMIIAPFTLSLPIYLFVKFYALGFDHLINTFYTDIKVVTLNATVLGVFCSVTGVAAGVAFIIGYFRLSFYIFQLPFQTFLFLFIKINPSLSTKLTKKSPIFWDEMIFLRL